MAILDDVLTALKNAGTQLKSDLWKPQDVDFLKGKANDLIALEAKAASLADTDPRKAAYLAAAKDTVESVTLLAQIRIENAQQHIHDAIFDFFVKVAVPAVVQLLPGLGELAPLFGLATKAATG